MKRAFVIACSLLLLLSSGLVSNTLLHTLEDRYPQLPVAQAPTAPAMLVLGGGLSNNNDKGRPESLGGGADRLWMAAELYRAGKAPLIVITGRGERGARAILEAWRVPGSAIITETLSANTRENAEFSARILRERGIHEVIFVTSAWHMQRALATFRKTGLTLRPFPCDFWSSDDPHLEPNPSALADSKRALKEWLGYLLATLL